MLDIQRGVVAEDFITKLREAINQDTPGRPRTGVVRISEFKRSELTRCVPPDYLPKDPTKLMHAYLWEHLHGVVQEFILEWFDDTVDAIIENLEHRGIVKRGHEENGNMYPKDDFVSLSHAGVKLVLSGESLFPADTDNGVHFDQRQFHPELVKICRDLFSDGHFAPAIFEGCKLVNALVKAKSGIQGDGSSLMTTVFSPGKPVLCFNDLKSQTEKDEQQGRMLIFQGAMLAIRNPGAHEMVSLTDRTRALEYLSFLSLLLRFLDEAKK